MFELRIITSTVRPGRKGPIVANWIKEIAEKHGGFHVELLELGEINLPMMNEEHHPMLRKYQHEHTRKWSAEIDAADAFIFVTAEYDFNYPAPLRNALEYLYAEWGYKAAGLVSYGGLSGGTRASNALKADLSTFKVVPLSEAVHIPFFTRQITEDGKFVPHEQTENSAVHMLKELHRWTIGLKVIRETKAS